MSSEEQSLNKVVEDEDDLIYEMIFGMNSTEDKRGKKKDQIPPCSGPIPIPMNAKRNGPWDNITHETTGAQRQEEQEEDMDALKNIQENLKMKVKAEEKPCRKEGADITDYFNYGFDEESWKSYCYKHLTLRAAQQKLYTNIRVQKRHRRHEEKDSCFAHPSSGRTSIPIFRQSSATIGVTGGQPGPSSEVDGHPCVSVDPINTQVVTEMPPPSNVCSLFASTALPPFIYQGGPPLAPPPYRGHSEGFGHHSASLCPRSPGVSSSIRRNMSSGVIEGAKASERFICQHHCDRDRDRFRVQRHKKHKKHEKHSNRGSDRDRENRSSSNNSREEHMRHRGPKERGDKRHSLKDSGKKKKRHRGTETNMKDGKNHAAAGGGGGGGRVVRRDSQRTHKHKKAK